MEEQEPLTLESKNRKNCYSCGHDHRDSPDFCSNFSCACEKYQREKKTDFFGLSESKISRRTVTLAKEVEAELRKIQADMLVSTNRRVSFSKVLNELLKESLKVRSQQYLLR